MPLDHKEFTDQHQQNPMSVISRKRPTWTNYFMMQALMIARRSACIRRQVGALLVRDHQILSTGYNSPPAGFKHASEVGCYREYAKIPSASHIELCRGAHAEQNALALAAKKGLSIDGSTLYCTHAPCITCLKMLLNAGVRRIYFFQPYVDTDLILAEALENGSIIEYTQVDNAMFNALNELLDEQLPEISAE